RRSSSASGISVGSAGSPRKVNSRTGCRMESPSRRLLMLHINLLSRHQRGVDPARVALGRTKPDTPCVLTDWPIMSNGYGRRGHVSAHRAAYEEVHGPIPMRMQVHHRCRNKACVNADHLMLVTPREHSRIELGGSITHCPKGHPYTGE